MPRSRFHHYVQRAHLALFGNADEVLAVRNKSGNQFNIAASAIMAQNDLYAYESEDGITSAFEDGLTELENLTFPAINEIAESRALNPDKRKEVNTYLAASYLRNPTWRAMVLTQLEMWSNDAAPYVQQQENLPPFPTVGSEYDGMLLPDLLKTGKFKWKLNNAAYLHYVLENIDRVAGNIAEFKLSLVVSPNGRFVVSDHPLTMQHPGVDMTGGFSFKGPSAKCELTFPVSRHVTIVGVRGDALAQSEADAAVAQLNKRQMVGAARNVAALADSEDFKAGMERYASVAFKADIQRIAEAKGIAKRARQGYFPRASWIAVKDDFVPLATLL